MSYDNDGPRFGFAHRRLDCYRIAVELAVAARALARQLSADEKKLSDQLTRATIAVPLLVAEGANRRHPREKRQRFNEALGECGEVAAACELIAAFGLAPPHECENIVRLAERTSAMLCALIGCQDVKRGA